MTFYKFHGTGNDFILFDNRERNIVLSAAQVAHLCHRRCGIGADGLMLLGNAEAYDFSMAYYNADGLESSMCGNGGRCITALAKLLGIIGQSASFTAIDGHHTAQIMDNGLIQLRMNDVHGIAIHDGYTILDTGSPHYILWVKNVKDIDVFREGRSIRNQPQFLPKGINVNFVQAEGDKLYVRTYERGVEDETLSCGTGITAAAIAATCKGTGNFHSFIETPGGSLEVRFTKPAALSATNVLLTGPAAFVYKGEIDLS